jgi:hypothetical protein
MSGRSKPIVGHDCSVEPYGLPAQAEVYSKVRSMMLVLCAPGFTTYWPQCHSVRFKSGIRCVRLEVRAGNQIFASKFNNFAIPIPSVRACDQASCPATGYLRQTSGFASPRAVPSIKVLVQNASFLRILTPLLLRVSRRIRTSTQSLSHRHVQPAPFGGSSLAGH